MINTKLHSLKLLPLFLILSIGLTSCGNKTYEEETVELLDPVNASQSYFETEYRNMYSSKVYTSVITPEVTEYSYDSGVTFNSYGAVVGDDVKKGTVLIKGKTESLDKQIENLEDSIADALESYQEKVTDLNDSLSKAKSDEKYYGQIVDNFESMKEDEQKAYANFSSEYAKYDYLYKSSVLKRMSLEEDIKENDELYNLDHAHNLESLNNLKSQLSELVLKSDTGGRVVAMQYLNTDDYIQRDKSLVAVGDLSTKEFKTEYISKSVMSKALDVYALVNGVRYEVNYHALDTEEYNRLYKQYEVVYSTFGIEDPENVLSIGDFVTLIIILDERENVLCVPSNSVYSDDSGKYVYALDENDSPVYTQVKTGMSDGLYTEILSGLSEGDKISSDYTVDEKKSTYTLEKGRIYKEFSESGYLYYPKTDWITNPVDYGTAYIDELCVSRYEKVEKGQLIAKVHVDSDTVEILRQERKLQRLNEELSELKEDEEANEKAIKYKNEAIADVTKLINDMKSDAGIVEIKAPNSGIIVDIKEFEEGDILQPDAKIVELSDGSSSYLLIEDSNNQLTLGNEVTIEYKDANREEKEATGTVGTISNLSLTPDLNSDYTIVLIPEEYIGSMAASSEGYEGWWNRTRFTAKAETRSADNVLLVPKKAVKEKDGNTYVTVKNEDGRYTLVSFIAGGSDNNYYWVAEGLTEGMVICLD